MPGINQSKPSRMVVCGLLVLGLLGPPTPPTHAGEAPRFYTRPRASCPRCTLSREQRELLSEARYLGSGDFLVRVLEHDRGVLPPLALLGERHIKREAASRVGARLVEQFGATAVETGVYNPMGSKLLFPHDAASRWQAPALRQLLQRALQSPLVPVLSFRGALLERTRSLLRGPLAATEEHRAIYGEFDSTIRVALQRRLTPEPIPADLPLRARVDRLAPGLLNAYGLKPRAPVGRALIPSIERRALAGAARLAQGLTDPNEDAATFRYALKTLQSLLKEPPPTTVAARPIAALEGSYWPIERPAQRALRAFAARSTLDATARIGLGPALLGLALQLGPTSSSGTTAALGAWLAAAAMTLAARRVAGWSYDVDGRVLSLDDVRNHALAPWIAPASSLMPYRDRAMARDLLDYVRDARRPDGPILVIVGRDHVPGMLEHLAHANYRVSDLWRRR